MLREALFKPYIQIRHNDQKTKVLTPVLQPKVHDEVKKSFTTWRFSVKKLEMKKRKVNFFLVNECNK